MGKQDKPDRDKPDRDKPKDKPRRTGKLMNRAMSDVSLMLQPQYNMIDREQQIAQQDYLQGLQALNAAYGGYQQELAGMPALPTEDYANRLQQQVAGLSGLLSGGGVDMSMYGATELPTGMPAQEVAAGQGMGATLGAGALGDLYSQAMRGDVWQQSAQREGGLAQRYGAENLAQSMDDTLRALRDRRLDVTDQTYLLEKQRLDELRQQHMENQLIQNKIQNDEAFADWLMGDLQSAAEDRGRDRNSDGKDGKDTPDQPPQDEVTASDKKLGTIQDWRLGDLQWGELTKPQRRRIRRKDIERFPPRRRR